MLRETTNFTKRVRVFTLMVIFIIGFHFTPSSVSAQNYGKISGKVTEATSGSYLPGANVIIMNTVTGTAADIQGRYTLSKIEPGTYQLKASFLGYQEQILEVTVQSNHTVVVDFSLQETTTELQTAVVYGELTRGQAKSLNEQKNAANIKNVVSSEQFQLFPDRNAAETVSRIPGISIAYDQGEGEMIQIRGIAPEYNSLTVNGQRIPAPDPDAERAVGLDLLNQDLMENIVVTKALTPDIDGDAIGGNVNFQMKQAPDAGVFAVNLGGGYNAQSSDYNKYGNDIIDISGYGGTRFFDNKLGVLFAASYYKTNRGSTLREFEYDDLSAGHIFAQHSNDYDVKRQRWGINLNTEYKFDEFNKIFLNVNHNQYLDDEIRRLNEWVIDDAEETKETRNRLEDQTLSTIMFGGNHNFDGIKLDYQASWIKAQEDMPARTYFRFQRDFDFSGYTNDQIKEFSPSTEFPGQAESLELNRIRIDDKLKQDADLAGLFNIEFPIELMDRESKLKFGGKYLSKSVKFEEVRLEMKKFAEDHVLGEGEWGFEDVVVQPDQVGYLGAETNKYLDMSDDNYDASESVIAAYGMTTINFNDKFSILAGARFENTTNNYKTLAIESANQQEAEASYSSFLPSIHFTYRFNDNMNLRFAYSSGISRPNYKSLVPVEFRDDDEREISRGNPDLEPTKSMNFDLMFENYTSYLGLFSAGIYYKKMTDIIVSTTVFEDLPYEGGTQQYEIRMPINGDSDATIYGIELALNQKLNFLNVPFLSNFSIYANYTYTKAEIEVGGRKLPMGSSPEHIANLALMYDNPEIGLSFVISNNFRDDILQSVGSDVYTDSYFESEYHLDISVSQKIMDHVTLFLQLNNLTNQQERQRFGDPTEDYSKVQQWARFGSYGTLGITYRL